MYFCSTFVVFVHTVWIQPTTVTDEFLSHFPPTAEKYGNSGGPLVNLVSGVVNTLINHYRIE